MIYAETFIQEDRESNDEVANFTLFESEANHAEAAETRSGYLADNENSEDEDYAESDDDVVEEVELQNNENIEGNNAHMVDDDSRRSDSELDDAMNITPNGYDDNLSLSESELKLYDEIDDLCMSENEMDSGLTNNNKSELQVFKETWLKKSFIRVTCDPEFNYVDEDIKEIQLGVNQLNEILRHS